MNGTRRSLRFVVGLATATLLALALAGFRTGWNNLWLTPDQRGRILLARGEAAQAARAFADPMWRGVANFRAGDFKSAVQDFTGVDSAEAAYDQGNALVMLGKYQDALVSYGRALTLRPGWPDAQANRELARIRGERLKSDDGAPDDAVESPDQIIYDKTKKGGEDAEVQGQKSAMSDASVRALWLKRVQTRPADFLRARFAHQLQESEAKRGSPPP